MAWGNTNTYDELPAFRTYSDAWNHLTTTVPIRGRAEETIPLGARRYADDFSIGTPQGQPREYGVPIELRMHGKPCVVFEVRDVGPAETTHITISSPWNYWAMGVVKFINATVRGARSVYTKRGVLVIEYGVRAAYDVQEAAVSVGKGKSASFCVWRGGAVFEPEAAKAMTTIRLNRVATNNVRKRFGGFYRYMKGMIKLRNVHETNAHGFETEGVTFTVYELLTALPADGIVEATNRFRLVRGGTINGMARINRDAVTSLTKKPAKVSTRIEWEGNDRIQITDSSEWDKWTAATQEYLALISPEGDADKTADYAKAFARLAAEVCLVSSMPFAYEGVTIQPAKLTEVADEVLFKVFSDEVFDTVEMEAGKVPSFKYDQWITRDKE